MKFYSAILNVGGWWTGSNESKCDEFIHRDREAHYCNMGDASWHGGARFFPISHGAACAPVYF